eukprot:GHRQ01017871.1.p2 GENE.GHRQ01017871.1~~GHRQ01017871.1.p2  ORF type:complete len:113 (+),score=11.50 GHRQ01017871.1:820-1158(+)
MGLTATTAAAIKQLAAQEAEQLTPLEAANVRKSYTHPYCYLQRQNNALSHLQSFGSVAANSIMALHSCVLPHHDPILPSATCLILSSVTPSCRSTPSCKRLSAGWRCCLSLW